MLGKSATFVLRGEAPFVFLITNFKKSISLTHVDFFSKVTRKIVVTFYVFFPRESLRLQFSCLAFRFLLKHCLRNWAGLLTNLTGKS